MAGTFLLGIQEGDWVLSPARLSSLNGSLKARGGWKSGQTSSLNNPSSPPDMIDNSDPEVRQDESHTLPLTVHPGAWGPAEGTLTSRRRPLWGEAIWLLSTFYWSPFLPPSLPIGTPDFSGGVTHPPIGGPFSTCFCIPSGV